MKNKICVIGTGYVGLITSIGLASMGLNVVGLDNNEDKIDKINNKQSPIYELGLNELLEKVIDEGKTIFTTNYAIAIKDADYIFLCLPTPSDSNGNADLKYVKESVAKFIPFLKDNVVVINKSTVPIGTGDMIEEQIKSLTNKKVFVASNPEFLREGNAIFDFFNPNRIVVGAQEQETFDRILNIYKSFKCPILQYNRRTSEMVKYASNSFLATKISFMNEIANICEAYGADVTKVAEGMGYDKRIGNKFLNAGLGFGGSCFPKDLRALSHLADDKNIDTKILKSAIDVNINRINHVIQIIKNNLGENLKSKKFIILGASFKPETDDLRESQSIELIKTLVNLQNSITVFDPLVNIDSMKISNVKSLTNMKDIYKESIDTDLIILATEWKDFKSINFSRLSKKMKNKILFDTRNFFDKDHIEQNNIRYIGIGK